MIAAGNSAKVNIAAWAGSSDVLTAENPARVSIPMLFRVNWRVTCTPTGVSVVVLAGVTGAICAPLISASPFPVIESSGCGSVNAMQRLLVTDGSAGLVGTQTSFA